MFQTYRHTCVYDCLAFIQDYYQRLLLKTYVRVRLFSKEFNTLKSQYTKNADTLKSKLYTLTFHFKVILNPLLPKLISLGREIITYQPICQN